MQPWPSLRQATGGRAVARKGGAAVGKDGGNSGAGLQAAKRTDEMRGAGHPKVPPDRMARCGQK